MMRLRIQYIILILVLCLTVFQGSAQITVSEFIASSLESPEVRVFDEQISYLDQKSYRLSPLQKFEFRFRNREMMEGYNEVGLRFTPTNPWEMKYTNKYFQAFQGSLSSEREVLLKEVLVSRYYMVAYTLYYSELRNMYADVKELVDRQIAILEKQQTSSFFDADDYVELKMKQLNRMVEFEEADFEFQDQLRKMEKAYTKNNTNPIIWDQSKFITVEKIKWLLDSLVREELKPAVVSYQEHRLAMAEHDYKLEKSNFNLGFFQTSYDNRRAIQDRVPVNISFGINIPITNPNKGDMAKRKVKAIEESYELEDVTKDADIERHVSYQNLVSLIKRYEILENRIAELEDSKLIKSLSTLKGGDPLIVVQYREDILKLSTLLVKLKRDINIMYIDYLAASDHIQRSPIINFLYQDLTSLQTTK
jgi:hypothetical protein